MSQLPRPTVDPKRYRQVLGQYPTGVCVVAGRRDDGEIVAMVVGSFTSVSLDPPLVGFFPDRGSSSWAKLRDCEHFSINVLAADQETVCRKLASKDPDKFAGTSHRLSERGNPILDGTVGWIECDRHSISDAGDHEIVLGRISDLDIGSGGLPLLFFQGEYGGFSPASLGAGEGSGLTLAQLKAVDQARPIMERLARELDGRCIVSVPVGDSLVVAASAGQARDGGTATLVGQRLPFAWPTNSIFLAGKTASDKEAWFLQNSDAERIPAALATLKWVRDRGYSVGLLNDAHRAFVARLAHLGEAGEHGPPLTSFMNGLVYDPPELTPDTLRAVRLVTAPIRNNDGDVAMALTLFDFGRPTGADGIEGYIEAVVSSANAVSVSCGGAHPRAS
ncbi:flavin reductase [Sphingomonas sp. ID0503]|uniref:flavin reductase n=1 Tax=Sphingomonas sp. ID0503 TaxID=3399691 RepID=UPI003AFB4829